MRFRSCSKPRKADIALAVLAILLLLANLALLYLLHRGLTTYQFRIRVTSGERLTIGSTPQ